MTKARECEGKRQHKTKAIAKNSLWSMYRYQGAKPGMISVYHCRFCGFWHVGHTRRYRKHRKN